MECERQPTSQVYIRERFTDVRRFRWVACQLDSLESCLTLPKLRKVLATLPRTLNDTYARILCGMDAEYRQYALHLLQWLAFSEQPLRLEELAEVLAIDVNNTPKFDPQRRLADPHDIVEICSSLITVTSSQEYMGFGPSGLHPKAIVTLAHFSVKEYLTSESIIQGQATEFSFQELDCHVSLANDCLAYLHHFDVAITDSEEEVSAEYPLLRYAVTHLTKHARMAEKRGTTLCSEFFLKRGEVFLNWIRLCNPDIPYSQYIHERRKSSFGNFASSLYYASILGLFEIVKTLCDMGADVNAIGGNFETALIAASFKDYIEIVNLLLEKGAQVDFEGSYGTALRVASCEGNPEIVRLLLDSGADVNVDDCDFDTALSQAIPSGHIEIVRLLLEHGADMNIPGSKDTLHSASGNGHAGIVRLLLEHGADVNLDDWNFGTALQQAVSQGDAEIIRLLLEHGADVNLSGTYGTALQLASNKGRTETVRLLLEYGADLDIMGDDTALLRASNYGYTEIVRLLLEHGADMNLSETYGTALEAATKAGHTMIVEMLLEKGAQPLPRDA